MHRLKPVCRFHNFTDFNYIKKNHYIQEGGGVSNKCKVKKAYNSSLSSLYLQIRTVARREIENIKLITNLKCHLFQVYTY